jgi:hypothetical protein
MLHPAAQAYGADRFVVRPNGRSPGTPTEQSLYAVGKSIKLVSRHHADQQEAPMPAIEPVPERDPREDRELRAALEEILAEHGRRRTLPPVEKSRGHVGVAAAAIIGVVVLVMVLAQAGRPQNAQVYPLGAYLAHVGSIFLSSCEEHGAVIACSCARGYLGQSESASLPMVAGGSAGIYPASFQGTIETCHGL